jgi:hypothetical protein
MRNFSWPIISLYFRIRENTETSRSRGLLTKTRLLLCIMATTIPFPLIAPVDEENSIYQGYIPIHVNRDAKSRFWNC